MSSNSRSKYIAGTESDFERRLHILYDEESLEQIQSEGQTYITSPEKFDRWNREYTKRWKSATGSNVYSDNTALFDVDALGYFNRINAAGSSISHTAMLAVDSFVKGLKADGVWELIYELLLLAGPNTLTGALQKLKFTSAGGSVALGTNLVSADYAASGPSLGVTSTATNKVVNSQFNLNNTSGAVGQFVFVPRVGATVTGLICGSRASINPQLGVFDLRTISSGGLGAFSRSGDSTASMGLATLPGLIHHQFNTTTSRVNFLNGTPSDLFTTEYAFTRGGNWGILSAPGINAGSHTVALGGLAQGMTDAQAASLYTRVNTLMTALGWTA